MLTYDDLKNCHALVREAYDIRERIGRLRSLAEWCVTPEPTEGRGQGETSDRVAKMAVEIADMEAEGMTKSAAYIQHAQLVNEAISEIPDGTQRTILRLRYLDGLTWEQISEKEHYSERHCKRLHKAGMCALGVWQERCPEMSRESVV